MRCLNSSSVAIFFFFALRDHLILSLKLLIFVVRVFILEVSLHKLLLLHSSYLILHLLNFFSKLSTRNGIQLSLLSL